MAESVKNKIFVLDTNVLMHDPTCVFRFEENDLYIPMVVLEELDGLKKGTSEAARTARQVSRLLDELVAEQDHSQIEQGLQIPSGIGRRDNVSGSGRKKAAETGRLFFQTTPSETELPGILPGNKADNAILLSALSLTKRHPDWRVTLVSKDINLRIKSTIVGIRMQTCCPPVTPSCRKPSGIPTATRWRAGRTSADVRSIGSMARALKMLTSTSSCTCPMTTASAASNSWFRTWMRTTRLCA